MGSSSTIYYGLTENRRSRVVAETQEGVILEQHLVRVEAARLKYGSRFRGQLFMQVDEVMVGRRSKRLRSSR